MRPHWWQTASGMVRPYLKAHGRTLADLTADLDQYAALGIDTVEVFAPLHGGVCYNGLDTLDFYTIDPAIGTQADFEALLRAAHQRGMAVAVILSGLTVSNVIGVPAGTAIGNLWGWRATFWVMGALGILAGLAMLVLLPWTAGSTTRPVGLAREVRVLVSTREKLAPSA
ncbi:MAG TPA: MFS transporter, partial [Anaerolinea sp.]|nr:MFS transporter [Anaerolinea sp.]